MEFAGAVTSSASAPSRCTPRATMFVQLAGRPARQESQAPHFGSGSQTTRSPTGMSVTAEPTARIRPTSSWPITTGGVEGWPGGTFRIWTSEPQIPHASTEITTSSGAGSGSATSRTSSRPSPSNTAARTGLVPPTDERESREPAPADHLGEALERLAVERPRLVDDRLLRAGRAPATEQRGHFRLRVGERRPGGHAPRPLGRPAVPAEDRPERIDRRLAGVADADRRHADRSADRIRIAAELLAPLVEDTVLVAVDLRNALAVPDVRV